MREMPTEGEMKPRDKYSVFDRKVRGYRKGVHSEFYSCPFIFFGVGEDDGDGCEEGWEAWKHERTFVKLLSWEIFVLTR